MALITWKNLTETEQDNLKIVTSSANKMILEEQGLSALVKNRTFLALTSPTTAQTLAQVKALTKQNNAIIRLLLNKLDGVD